MDSKIWIIVVSLFVIFYLCVRILERLPPQTKEVDFASQPAGSSNFAIWMEADELWFEEFEVGYVDEWLGGHKFTVWGKAEFKPDWNIERGSFDFYASRKALAGSDIIGWGKKSTESVKLHVSLTPDVAKNLFDELLRTKQPHLHAQGFVDAEGKIKITYLTMSPTENTISLKQI